jgi:hypothetical protein
MPVLTTEQLRLMSSREKLAEAMRRSLPYLPAEARGIVLQMLQPASLALIAGTLAVWAGSHFFGVGEIADLILLGVGAVALGLSVLTGARELSDFATTALGAQSDAGLDRAARHFATAVTILGISAVQAVLLRGQARTAIARGRPQIYPRIQVEPPPPPGNQLRLSRPPNIPGGSLGVTDAYGAVEVSRDQSLTEQRLTLLHELVHRYFSPRTGPLRQLRAELSISGYVRSALLQYLEEALAEGYAQLRMNGLGQALRAYRFPTQAGYVTVSQLAAEGQAIGTITLGGTLFYVSISSGPMPPER